MGQSVMWALIEANKKDKGNKTGRSIWILLQARAEWAELERGPHAERNPF